MTKEDSQQEQKVLVVLEQMYIEGILTEEQYSEALKNEQLL